MFVRRSLLLVLLLFVTLVSPVRAWTSRTAESIALGNIGSFIKFFESEKKQLPQSWKELDDFWKKPLDEVYPLVLPTRRYDLFNPPLELRIHGKWSMQVVAITRKPMIETTRTGNLGRTIALKGPGRYALYRGEDGNYRYQWFDESAIQHVWPSTGRALPIPDDEPERPWVKSARWQILMKRVGIGALAVFIALWIVQRWREKSNSRSVHSGG